MTLATPRVAGTQRGDRFRPSEVHHFIDDDDYVSPAFLEVLLANAGPRLSPSQPLWTWDQLAKTQITDQPGAHASTLGRLNRTIQIRCNDG